MIYTSTGYKKSKMTAMKSKEDDFETIVQTKVTLFTDMASLEPIKYYRAPYFLAGELSEAVRNNDNLLSKSLLAIDYDNLKLTEKEFEAHLLSRIRILNYYAYPSIQHGLKGTRYRLIIKTSRPFFEEENVPLIKFITDIIGLPYDKASAIWSQAMGLPVTFESDVETYQGKCFLNRGLDVLDVDMAIKTMREQHTDQHIRSPHRRKRTVTSEILESLIEPVYEGSRNVQLTKRIGKLFSLGMKVEIVYKYAHVINEVSFDPPLTEKEVEMTFRSVFKKDIKKLEKRSD